MRTFIAIELEEEVKDHLANIQVETQKLCRKGNYTPKDNFHLTLHFLGEVEEDDLDYLQEAIFETARRNRPFTLTLDKIGFFPRGNKGIMWAGLEKSTHLQRLFSTLEKSLEQQGFARERKGLSPHITLGREVEPHRSFMDVQKGVKVEPMRISVRSISLMESVRKGPKLVYVPLFRQNLIGK
ncbi:RNA 2',3'-cyclic phosphodiesterase [Anaerotignum sp.]|nr:RNA 2',3'-cyclic phosphodiesterase [Anaerotignum sp.]MBQ7758919.1 RNA 2',3'-cyclic phosphodiesterase [Anaerotignum sp.]